MRSSRKQKKKSYKGYVIASMFVVLLGVSFLYGSHVGATNINWSAQIVSDAQDKMTTTTNTQIDALTTDMNKSLVATLEQDFAASIQQKQDFLVGFIQNYFKGKLSGLKDTPEYRNIQSQIDQIQDQQIAIAKQKIDEAIAGHVN